jgi:hypothetical protein
MVSPMERFQREDVIQQGLYMFFRRVYILRDMSLHDDDHFAFSAAPPCQITLEIRPPSEEEAASLSKDDCLCILRADEAVADNVRPQFEILNEYQPEVNEIRKAIIDRLDEYMQQTVNVLRWRRGKTGCFNAVHTTRDLEWSDDDLTWRQVPKPPIIGITVVQGIPWSRLTDEVQESVTNLLKAGVGEPLAHELFHEAWSLQIDNPRSSLIIGIAAAEVGIKSLIGFLVPEAEWLAFNSPSPPIEKILRNYLPLLPTKQSFNHAAPFIPKNVLKLLREAVEYRNQTTHAGKTKDPISADTLKHTLIAVRDLLYILDVYAGHEWALNKLSIPTIEAIKSETSRARDKDQE